MRANTARVATAVAYAPVGYYEPVEAAFNTAMEAARSIVLACAAPFIGLAFVVGLPFIGLAALAWMVVRTTFVKNLALFAVAPFVGLAYAVAFPFVGIALLAWVGVRAALKRPVAA